MNPLVKPRDVSMDLRRVHFFFMLPSINFNSPHNLSVLVELQKFELQFHVTIMTQSTT